MNMINISKRVTLFRIAFFFLLNYTFLFSWYACSRGKHWDRRTVLQLTPEDKMKGLSDC